MIIHNCEQGTEEWLNKRLKKVTASNFDKVLAGGKGITRTKYLYKVAAEILTGQAEDGYTNAAMEWGTQTEPQARAMYELINNTDVEQVGFVERSEYVGCSPDGLLSDKGLIEIKCPNTTTFIEYKLADRLPPAYKAQVQGQLWICEREWCDFVAFDPRVPQGFMSVRVERDDAYIKTLEKEVDIFVNEMLIIVDKLS